MFWTRSSTRPGCLAQASVVPHNSQDPPLPPRTAPGSSIEQPRHSLPILFILDDPKLAVTGEGVIETVIRKASKLHLVPVCLSLTWQCVRVRGSETEPDATYRTLMQYPGDTYHQLEMFLFGCCRFSDYLTCFRSCAMSHESVSFITPGVCQIVISVVYWPGASHILSQVSAHPVRCHLWSLSP